MAYSIEVDDSLLLVRVKFWEDVNQNGFLSYLNQMEAIGPFDDTFRLLLVLMEDVQLDLPTSFLRGAASRRPLFSRTALRVVVASSQLAFGLSRLYALEAPTASGQYSIVKSLDEACEILSLNPGSLDAFYAD